LYLFNIRKGDRGRDNLRSRVESVLRGKEGRGGREARAELLLYGLEGVKGEWRSRWESGLVEP